MVDVRFLLTLLEDAVALLESNDIVFNSDDTHELASCLDQLIEDGVVDVKTSCLPKEYPEQENKTNVEPKGIGKVDRNILKRYKHKMDFTMKRRTQFTLYTAANGAIPIGGLGGDDQFSLRDNHYLFVHWQQCKIGHSESESGDDHGRLKMRWGTGRITGRETGKLDGGTTALW
uniref:Uncharacterized protein n=1 Tax=Timema cristinae TaxID=61476 RepID=A0A7R9D3K6_TIMCR|nr:unnamed protein product [Timema cristinae]